MVLTGPNPRDTLGGHSRNPTAGSEKGHIGKHMTRAKEQLDKISSEACMPLFSLRKTRCLFFCIRNLLSCSLKRQLLWKTPNPTDREEIKRKGWTSYSLESIPDCLSDDSGLSFIYRVCHFLDGEKGNEEKQIFFIVQVSFKSDKLKNLKSVIKRMRTD